MVDVAFNPIDSPSPMIKIKKKKKKAGGHTPQNAVMVLGLQDN